MGVTWLILDEKLIAELTRVPGSPLVKNDLSNKVKLKKKQSPKKTKKEQKTTKRREWTSMLFALLLRCIGCATMCTLYSLTITPSEYGGADTEAPTFKGKNR